MSAYRTNSGKFAICAIRSAARKLSRRPLEITESFNDEEDIQENYSKT
jgi:hypothetical protein